LLDACNAGHDVVESCPSDYHDLGATEITSHKMI